jgi:hypothetical protein
MILYDLDVERVAVIPFKAYSPLFVDADCILSFPVAAESVKHVSRIQHQGIQTWRRIQDRQSLSSLPLERLETPNSSVIKKFLSIPAGKCFDHAKKILRRT